MKTFGRSTKLHIHALEERACPALFTASTVADLRTALTTALTNGVNDTITLTAATYAFSTADNNVAGGNALPVVVDDAGTTVTIVGQGAMLTLAPQSEPMRFFAVNGGRLLLDSLELVGGRPEFGNGGAVLVQAGQFDANACLFRNNFSDFDGGAIAYDTGTTSGFLSNSTFTANGSLGSNETFQPQGGGAIFADLASRLNDPVVTIRNCTIVNNTVQGLLGEAELGGGGVLLIGGGAIDIENSVIAGNEVSDEPDDVYQEHIETQGGQDFVGTINARNSLIQANLEFVNGSQINVLPVDTNPQLGPLANNGGRTQTFALLAGSPLINAGDQAFVTGQTDQRGPGFARLRGVVDIGAFEVQPRALRLALAQSSAVTRLNQRVTFTKTVRPAIVGSPVPTGSVAFYDHGRLLGRVRLNAQGRAILSTTRLAVGRHSIVAVYSGDENYDPGRRSVVHTVLGSIIGRRWDR